MERVVSGIRPTGQLHLGNYFGAMVNFVKMQRECDCLFFIADLHSLTTHPTPADLRGNVAQTLAEYLASGLDPELSTIYIQSDVPEVCELYTLMNMNAYVGELSRTTSFKDKVRQAPDNVNAGLLTYPVLMACDILLHHARKVPVGKDQEQHLEMTRLYARRFNQMYGTDYFAEPDAFNFGRQLTKIPGLDGTGKMGKSDGNGIYLADEPAAIRKKVMRAVTDSGPSEPNSPVAEPIANLFTIMEAVSAPDTLAHFRAAYADCTIRYGDLKKQLAEDIVAFTEPIRQRILEIKADTSYLAGVARRGAERARESAAKTVREVREIIGIKSLF